MTMNFATFFHGGHTYQNFLAKYGTPDQQQRWARLHARVKLSDAQKELLRSFKREMKVLVMAGAWCGDCVQQCPIFDQFAQASNKIDIRYFDRDADADLMRLFPTCGGARVPTVVFLSDDGQICGRMGDRTLARYRQLAAPFAGPACSTGYAVGDSVADQVVQEWLNEFERIQWMLRTSPRLRQKHGD